MRSESLRYRQAGIDLWRHENQSPATHTKTLRRARSHFLAAATLSLCLLVPGIAASAILVTINDLTETFSTTINGPLFSFSVTRIPETDTAVGSDIVNIFYRSQDAPVGGGPRTNNYNIFGADDMGVSDTLQIIVSEITGTPDFNVHVQIFFLSDSLNEQVFPPPLPNASIIFESNGFQDVPNTGLSDLRVRFASVPEPVTLALVGIGLAGLGFRRRK